jgi:hypothetical protein
MIYTYQDEGEDIETDVKNTVCESVNWIQLEENIIQRPALANTAMNFLVSVVNIFGS